MKFFTTALVIITAAVPCMAFTANVKLWTEYGARGSMIQYANSGECINFPGNFDNRVRSVEVYPAPYVCDFWLDFNCNNNGGDGTKCGQPGSGPFHYGAGINNVAGKGTCPASAPLSSFKCYPN